MIPTMRTTMIRELPEVGGERRFIKLADDEYFCTEDGAKTGVTFENTSETEPLVCLRYFGPEVNPDAPAMGAYRKNKF